MADSVRAEGLAAFEKQKEDRLRQEALAKEREMEANERIAYKKAQISAQKMAEREKKLLEEAEAAAKAEEEARQMQLEKQRLRMAKFEKEQAERARLQKEEKEREERERERVAFARQESVKVMLTEKEEQRRQEEEAEAKKAAEEADATAARQHNALADFEHTRRLKNMSPEERRKYLEEIEMQQRKARQAEKGDCLFNCSLS